MMPHSILAPIDGPGPSSGGRPVKVQEGKATPMEMHQIRYFLALCEERSFTRAARRCGVTQPSLTNAIRALERELNGVLFHRKPRVEATELGRAIRPYLQDVTRNTQVVEELARVAAPPSIPAIQAHFHAATYAAGEAMRTEQP